MALNGDWYEAKPAAHPEEQRRNERAAERALEFTIGWFARPLYQVGGPDGLGAGLGGVGGHAWWCMGVGSGAHASLHWQTVKPALAAHTCSPPPTLTPRTCRATTPP